MDVGIGILAEVRHQRTDRGIGTELPPLVGKLSRVIRNAPSRDVGADVRISRVSGLAALLAVCKPSRNLLLDIGMDLRVLPTWLDLGKDLVIPGEVSKDMASGGLGRKTLPFAHKT